MERRDPEGRRYIPGKIISLAQFIEEHREALNYDLITKTHYQVEDVGGVLSWDALDSFIKHIGPSSALAQDLGYNLEGWDTRVKTNAILADIYDILQMINRNIIAANSKKHINEKITPYPRPGREKKERALGRDGLPKNELLAWIEQKRRKKVETHG